MLSPASGLSASPLSGSGAGQRQTRANPRPESSPTPQQAATLGPGGPDSAESATAPRGATSASASGLTPEEEQAVAELAATDRQVRAHEQAHIAAAGGLTGAVSFTYTTGPDGKQYAVGGEVSIDTSPVSGNPAATIRKAQQIRAAANAPANPSGQDRAVAAQASQMEAVARQELAEQTRRELQTQNTVALARAYGTPETDSSGPALLSLIA